MSNTRAWRVVLLTLGIIFVISSGLATSPPLTTSVAASPQVIGNPDEIRYEGKGGLILPPSVSRDDRNRVAGCRDCSWKMTPACVPGPNNYCDAAVRSCPGLIDHVRTWFRPPNGDWTETGLICLTTYRFTTVEAIDRFISEHFHQYLPPLEPRCWPARNVIVQMPYVCASGQGQGIQSWTHSVGSENVNVMAIPHWVWNFNGSRLQTTSPGGPFPNLSVSHTFVDHGNKLVGVESRWEGSFTVGELGPFDIETRLSQSRSWVVPAGEARARLMPAG